MAEVGDWADLIGKPFRYGGRGPDAFDCYGLVAEMRRRSGLAVPDYISPRNDEEIAALIATNVPLWVPCELRPGALVALRLGRFVSHVGFALSETQIIHAWQRTGGVTVEPIAAWQRRIAGTYTFRE